MVMGEFTQETEVLVIGSGPGGYAAAFRAADLGMEVTMVDPSDRPGGECLFRGCIPSKILLYMSELLYDAKRAGGMGIKFAEPEIDLEGIRNHKSGVIDNLAEGLAGLGKRRGVQLIKARAVFEGSDKVRLFGGDLTHIKFRHGILATGSRPIALEGAEFQKGGRIMNSTAALALKDVPESLLVIGGGYVGLELGSVYASLGSRVSVVERGERLLPGTDPDLVEPLYDRLKEHLEKIYFNTKVTKLTEDSDGVDVRIEEPGGIRDLRFDRVLTAIGRRPNSDRIGLETTGVKLDKKGFVLVDEFRRTHDKRIFAVGDVVGDPMLAHKAIREGKVAAEVAAGKASAFDVRAIPAIVYTDPQIAWCGITELEARKQNIPIRVERFPWRYSGRAATMDAAQGMTKIIIDPETQRILGLGIVGRDTEGLIAEGVLAVEMGALAQDMALTIHAHPTLSETLEEADGIFLGTAIHVLPKKRGS